MKRHPAMRDLSSDHHQALVQGHRLQRAAKAGEAQCQTAIAGFLEFWRADGQRHFCEEEQALLPFFARWGELDCAPIAQMLREHALNSARRAAIKRRRNRRRTLSGIRRAAGRPRSIGRTRDFSAHRSGFARNSLKCFNRATESVA